MFALGRRQTQRTVNIWPGFVDGLASLLLVVVFVLMVFIIAQFFLSVALSGRDEALQQLEQRVGELSDLLSLERSANAELRLNVAQLSEELQSSTERRETLSAQLAELRDRRDGLEQKLAEARAEASDNSEELEQAYETIQADKQKLQVQLDQIAMLRSLREELRKDVARLETRLAAAQQLAEKRQAELNALDDRLAQVRTTSSNRQDKIAQLQDQLYEARQTADERQERIASLSNELEMTEDKLADQQSLTEDQEAKIDILNRQLSSLRRQMARLNTALDAQEAENVAKAAKIESLGERLNEALANKVEELARYRSEFFGRLRQVLGDRQNIRVVGDRFVFQSEVLFDSASANLGPSGAGQIRQLAETLKQVIDEIPDDINWILRVDGHTDRRPIDTARFPSNWELSTARAVEVVKFLIDQGIPPERLAATGFGAQQPLDTGNSEAALRRNRRIEFKLTTK